MYVSAKQQLRAAEAALAQILDTSADRRCNAGEVRPPAMAWPTHGLHPSSVPLGVGVADNPYVPHVSTSWSEFTPSLASPISPPVSSPSWSALGAQAAFDPPASPYKFPRGGDHFAGDYVCDPLGAGSPFIRQDTIHEPAMGGNSREAGLLNLLQSSLAQRDELRKLLNTRRRETRMVETLTNENAKLTAQLGAAIKLNKGMADELAALQKEHACCSFLKADLSNVRTQLEEARRMQQEVAETLAAKEREAGQLRIDKVRLHEQLELQLEEEGQRDGGLCKLREQMKALRSENVALESRFRDSQATWEDERSAIEALREQDQSLIEELLTFRDGNEEKQIEGAVQKNANLQARLKQLNWQYKLLAERCALLESPLTAAADKELRDALDQTLSRTSASSQHLRTLSLCVTIGKIMTARGEVRLAQPMLEESLVVMNRTIGHADKRTMAVVEALQTLKEKREQAEAEANCTLHVRNIGMELESEEQLRQFFEQWGLFRHAVVRHREDDDGNNTSWALVTMMDKPSMERILSARPIKYTNTLGKERELPVNIYSQKQAAASKGGMKAMAIINEGAMHSKTRTGKQKSRTKAPAIGGRHK